MWRVVKRVTFFHFYHIDSIFTDKSVREQDAQKSPQENQTLKMDRSIKRNETTLHESKEIVMTGFLSSN